MNQNRKSIIDMAQGAIKERADYEMARILDNIMDPNTAPTKKRTLTLQLVFSPDSERRQIGSLRGRLSLGPTCLTECLQ